MGISAFTIQYNSNIEVNQIYSTDQYEKLKTNWQAW